MSTSANAHHPTLVLGAGAFASEVAARLLARLAPALEAGAPRQTASLPNAALLALPADPAALRAELDRLLGLRALVEQGAAGDGGFPPTLCVYAVAELAEEGAASRLVEGIELLAGLCRGRYAPLFQPYRGALGSNYHCNPIVILPATGDRWPEQARAALARLEALHAEPGEPPAVSNIFVVGDSSSRYRLERAEQVEMVAGFLEQGGWGALGRTEAFGQLLRRDPDPYASFVCAIAEFDDLAVRRGCAARTAIELLEWMRRTTPQRTEVARRAAELEELFDVGRYRRLVPLEKGQAALTRLIDDQCPSFQSVFRDVRSGEDSEEMLEHYGARWHARNRERLQAATRELGLFRIDEIIEEVEANGAILVAEERERIDAFIDERLGAADEGTVADLAVSLRHLRKRLAAEVESIARRASAPLARAPDLASYDRAYAELERALWSKPRLRHLAFWGALGWLCGTVGLALLLRHLPPALGMAPGSSGTIALSPPWSWLSAAGVVGLLLAGYLTASVWRAHSAIRLMVGSSQSARRGTLLALLERLSRGSDDSLHAFYSSRFLRACDIWVHRTLRAVLKHVDDRLERVSAMQTTIELQVQALRASSGDEAPVRERAGAEEGLARTLVGRSRLPGLCRDRRKPRELPAVVKEYCRRERPFERWRSELPFSDRDAVVLGCLPFFASLAEASVLEQPDLAGEARARLAAFFSELGGRLDVPLDFAGRSFRDPDEADRSLGAALIVGRPVADLVREALGEQAGRWELLTEEAVGNRVVLCRLVTGISAAAVRWHDSGSPPARTPGEEP
jgi:hypothetical protein